MNRILTAVITSLLTISYGATLIAANANQIRKNLDWSAGLTKDDVDSLITAYQHCLIRQGHAPLPLALERANLQRALQKQIDGGESIEQAVRHLCNEHSAHQKDRALTSKCNFLRTAAEAIAVPLLTLKLFSNL